MAHWSPSHIFHPTDFTEDDYVAFAHALRITVGTKGELCLLHCGEAEDSVHWEHFPHVRKTLAAWGCVDDDKGAKGLHALGISCSKVQLNERKAVSAVLHYIETHRPDLAVMKTHQRSGLAHLLDPSVGLPIARHSGVPTLFLPSHIEGFVDAETGRVTLRRILIPVQDGLRSQAAIRAAEALALAVDATRVHLTLLYGDKREDEHDVSAPAREGWETEKLEIKGNPMDAVAEVAAERAIDLIVVRTPGVCGLFDALIGTPVERLIAHSECAVLAIPRSKDGHS